MGAPLVPLNSLEGIDRFVACGAEEFYLGFYDPQWEAAFGCQAGVNRMSGFGIRANAFAFPQALIAVQALKMRGKRAFVTFNASAYGAPMDEWVLGYFQQLAWAGADGVILSGPEYVDVAHECGLQAAASTMCAVYNRDIARFYADCGIDRIILPRDLSLDEIASIMRAVPEVAYEVFAMRNGCIYSDGHCLGTHGGENGALCGELRQARRRVRSVSDAQAAAANSTLHAREFHRYTCGLCALWDFEQMGVSAYKVVGRCDEQDAIAQDAALVARNVGIVRTCGTRREYLERMEPHPYAETVCDRRLNCYYPDALDGCEDVERGRLKEMDEGFSGWPSAEGPRPGDPGPFGGAFAIRLCGRLKPRCPCHRARTCPHIRNATRLSQG